MICKIKLLMFMFILSVLTNYKKITAAQAHGLPGFIHVTTLIGNPYPVGSAYFSHDGSKILTTSSTNAVWKTTTGECLLDFRENRGAIKVAGFNPDESKILIVSEAPRHEAKVYDIKTGQVLFSLAGDDGYIKYPNIKNARFSPNGSKILTFTKYMFKVWDANSGKQLCAIGNSPSSLTSAVFSPDGSKILTTSSDGTIKIWDAETGKNPYTFPIHSNSAVFSLDGSKILTVSNENIKVWNTTTKTCLFTLAKHKQSFWYIAAFSPDSSKILTKSDSTVEIFNANTGEKLHIIEDRTLTFNSAKFSPDNSKILISSDKLISVWGINIRLSKLATIDYSNYINGIRATSFSPDSNKILIISKDRDVKLLDSNTGVCLYTLVNKYALLAKFNSNGSKILVAFKDGTPQIYTDTRDTKRRRQILTLALAQHPRLGSTSPANTLSQDLLHELCINYLKPDYFGPIEDGDYA